MQFKWMNESRLSESKERLELYAPAHTDFFYSSESAGEEGMPESLCNAPYYYTELKGDFVLKVKVSHDFVSTYDAAVVMIMKDMACWAKSCFEKTDFGTHAVVSVVTNGESDDANGCNIEGNTVWLQAVRMGNGGAHGECVCVPLLFGRRTVFYDALFPPARGRDRQSRAGRSVSAGRGRSAYL